MAKTALIIVDMVRDFTDPEGLYFILRIKRFFHGLKRFWMKAGNMNC